MRAGQRVAGASAWLVGAISALALAAPAASAAPIGFETPSVVDPIHTFGEPDVGVDPQGRVFVSGPTGTGTQRSVWFGSLDSGHTFRAISAGPAPSAIQSFTAPPGGGDTDIAFDRTGKQYFSDLYALVCLRNATTADGGATVFQSVFPAGCAGLPGADRQWLAVYDPPPGTPKDSPYTGPTPLIYEEFNNVSTGTQWVRSSAATDPEPGGPGLNFVNAQQDGPSSAAYTPAGADGYPAIDQQTGKVFQAVGTQVATNDYSLVLNIGTPDANGDLKFLDSGGDPGKLIHIADHLKGDPDVLFAVVSLDAARNLHAVWAVDDPTGGTDPARRQVYVSAASAASGWRSWTPAVQVSDGSTATGDAVNIFPWIQAGGAGRADAVWYGSDKLADPSTKAGQAWNAFMAQVVYPVGPTGTVTGARPSVQLVRVSPHPAHYQDACLLGSDCITQQGNRNLADFFGVRTDRTGAAEVVYDDTSNGLAQPGFTPGGAELVDHSGAPVVTLARQSSGPGLLGTQTSGPSNAPVAGLDDPAGDARYPVIGGANVPGFDLLGQTLSLSGGQLHVTIKLADAAHPGATAAVVPGTQDLEYVTRWQMGNTIYYAAMEQSSGGGDPTFYAGTAQSVDLCSVSACFPHVITYPEPGFTGGTAQHGSLSCPAAPSAASPCTATVDVDPAVVGSPTSASLLEEVGTYALAASAQQGTLTNAQAAADNVPIEVDGICCQNFGTPRAGGAGSGAGGVCPASGAFTHVAATPARRGVRIAFAHRGTGKVDVDVFQTSHGRTVIAERLVARFRGRARPFTWSGRANHASARTTDGYFFVRLRVRYAGRTDTRRLTLRRVRGHFLTRPSFYRRASCGTLSSYKLRRPAFGGPRNGPLGIAYRLGVPARVQVTVLRGRRVVRRFATVRGRAGHTYRLSFAAAGRPRGDYRVVLRAVPASGRAVTATLTSRRV